MLTSGQAAPEFSLHEPQRRGPELAALRGRNVLVYFYPQRRYARVHPAGLRVARHRRSDRRHGDPRDQPRQAGGAGPVPHQVWVELRPAVGPRSFDCRGLRCVEAEEELRQDIHGHRALGVPDRCDRDRSSNAWYKISPKDTPVRRSWKRSANDVVAASHRCAAAPPAVLVRRRARCARAGSQRCRHVATDGRRVVLPRPLPGSPDACRAC